MSKIRKAFEQGKALAAFLTCGDPNLETTRAAVEALVENKTDMIVLGIPFSDPTAEGPLLQESGIRALEGGITTDRVFTFVSELRRTVQLPLVFKTYANVVFSYGTERFLQRCRELSIDGLILPDLPFEEKEEFGPVCRKYGVDLISLIAPTSENRIAMIAGEAEGFLYLMSGGNGKDEQAIVRMARQARRYASVPCIVEADGILPQELSDAVDGVILGDTVVRLLNQYGEAAPEHIGEYVSTHKALAGVKASCAAQ